MTKVDWLYETCIACLKPFEEPGKRRRSDAHVIPESLGGKLSLTCLCAGCNNLIGTRYEDKLPLVETYANEMERFADIVPFFAKQLRKPGRTYVAQSEHGPLKMKRDRSDGAFRVVGPQLIHDVRWGELDYLVVDLPPGTGDVQLTMSQSIPMTGAVVVSTPQDVSIADVGKAIQMFNTLKVPNLGLIENMSYHICPHCGERSEIFGHGGARALAERMQIPFLGEIPLDQKIREGGGPGVPLMISDPQSPLAAVYREVASHLAAQVSIRNFKQSSFIPLRTI